jgi:hypothetical protein
MTFPLERAAFVREQRAGMYNAITYFVSKILIELPFQIMFPFIMIGALPYPLPPSPPPHTSQDQSRI